MLFWFITNRYGVAILGLQEFIIADAKNIVISSVMPTHSFWSPLEHEQIVIMSHFIIWIVSYTIVFCFDHNELFLVHKIVYFNSKDASLIRRAECPEMTALTHSMNNFSFQFV